MPGATNTIIQILRSGNTSYPTSLNPGEQAYSYVTDKLFVGGTGNEVLTTGGKYYTDLIDAATPSVVIDSIVSRDGAGNAAFRMVSITDSASRATDVVNKSYLDSRIGNITGNTIQDGTFGQNGYSNVFVNSAASGGSVGIVANNISVATFTKTAASFIGTIETSGSANVQSLTANGSIYAAQVIVSSNVELANVANVAYYASILQATGSPGLNKHYIMLSDNGNYGNTRIQANTLFAFDTANTTLAVGYSQYTPLPNTMYQGTGSTRSYVQNNLQNLNNEGSADWVATADNGSDSTGFIDMGIGGGNYNYQTSAGEVGPFRPNDGYIQVVGDTGQGKGNLLIMTGTANTSVAEVGSIIFSVGNQAYSNISGYISRQGNSPTGALTWAINKIPGISPANYSYKLDVNGSANVASLYINNKQVLNENNASTVDLTIQGSVKTSDVESYSSNTTVATVSQTSIDSFTAASYRTAKYLVQITQGTKHHSTEFMLVHNGTTVNAIEYAVVTTDGELGTFTADINSGSVRLLFTASDANSRTIRYFRTMVKV
jgi:hypothetical protein